MSPFSNFWFPDLLILSFLMSLFLWLVFTSFLTCEKVLCFSVFRESIQEFGRSYMCSFSPGIFVCSLCSLIIHHFMLYLIHFYINSILFFICTQKILTQYCGFPFFGSGRRKMLVPQGNIF